MLLQVLPQTTARQVLESLIALYPAYFMSLICVEDCRLRELEKGLVLSVNQEYVDMDALVFFKKGDEVAVIPPLSGG